VNYASVYLACQLDFPAQVLCANVCLLTRSTPRVLFRGEACLWHTQYNPTRRRSQSSDRHWAQTFPKGYYSALSFRAACPELVEGSVAACLEHSRKESRNLRLQWQTRLRQEIPRLPLVARNDEPGEPE